MGIFLQSRNARLLFFIVLSHRLFVLIFLLDLRAFSYTAVILVREKIFWKTPFQKLLGYIFGFMIMYLHDLITGSRYTCILVSDIKDWYQNDHWLHSKISLFFSFIDQDLISGERPKSSRRLMTMLKYFFCFFYWVNNLTGAQLSLTWGKRNIHRVITQFWSLISSCHF